MRRWNPDTGAWDEVTNVTNSLTHERAEHVSWTPADGSGTYLMGGRVDGWTSEIIDTDGNVGSSFSLSYNTE